MDRQVLREDLVDVQSVVPIEPNAVRNTESLSLLLARVSKPG